MINFYQNSINQKINETHFKRIYSLYQRLKLNDTFLNTIIYGNTWEKQKFLQKEKKKGKIIRYQFEI